MRQEQSSNRDEASALGGNMPATRGEFAYRAYGLGIRSDIALPELEPDNADADDIAIRLQKVAWPSPEVSGGAVIDLSADTQYLAWTRVGRFAIRGAREIDVEPAPDVSEALVRLPLLGPVTALLLYLRGHFVLHASAIEVGGKGAIFVGDKQAGKSTTAAVMVAAGHRLLADDVVAIDVSARGSPSILPGFPQLKLDRDAAIDGIAERSEALPLVQPSFAKLQHRLVGRFSHAPVPASCVYVLTRGANVAATPLSQSEALAALMRFSYVTRFGTDVLKEGRAAEHFERCAALASAGQVFRLMVPGKVDRLGEVVRLIERDLA